MKTTRLHRRDFKDGGYHGKADLSHVYGNLRIPGHLGRLYVPGTVGVAGRLWVGRGTDLVVGAWLIVGQSIRAGGSLQAGLMVVAGDFIRVRGALQAHSVKSGDQVVADYLCVDEFVAAPSVAVFTKAETLFGGCRVPLSCPGLTTVTGRVERFKLWLRLIWPRRRKTVAVFVPGLVEGPRTGPPGTVAMTYGETPPLRMRTVFQTVTPTGTRTIASDSDELLEEKYQAKQDDKSPWELTEEEKEAMGRVARETRDSLKERFPANPHDKSPRELTEEEKEAMAKIVRGMLDSLRAQFPAEPPPETPKIDAPPPPEDNKA